MKKLILIGLLSIGMALSSIASSVTSVTITNGTPLLALTGSYAIRSLSIVGNPYYSGTVMFYDAGTATTNLVLAAYNSVSQGSSNIVTTYVGLTGYTNTYTNTVLWTDYVTNSASTNALPTMAAYVVPPNFATTISSANLNFAKGAVIVCNATNIATGIQVIMTYDRLR